MFSGIVESLSKKISQSQTSSSLRFVLEKPKTFDDLKIGDSVCTNGVCLTVEKFDEKSIQFCLGAETLKILGVALESYLENSINLERSLKFGDRIHGHLVTGHVDGLARIVETYAEGDCWIIKVEVPSEFQTYFWRKGSICLNGVSLTVNNDVKENIVEVCLIPETIQKTNLAQFKVGSYLTFEADYFAKTMIQYHKQKMSEAPR